MSDSGTSFFDWLRTAPQYVLPQHAIARIVYRLTRIEKPAVKNRLIRHFIRRFGVNMNEAAAPDIDAYPCFNAFFTRALQKDARPLALEPGSIVCPVDGTVSQCGSVQEGYIFQAKGRDFSVLELLGGDTTLANTFAGGEFATLYLSPGNYHRIHMPLDGTLRHMLHVPGRLFSVNPPATRAVPRLFARNERVVTVFDTITGQMALVLVGALNVGSIETVWAGEITPARRHTLRARKYEDGDVVLKRGAELGRFNMGSTVILLFSRARIRWDAGLLSGAAVRMGARIATPL